jgi:uracil-DNA glycosylase family 4
MAKSVDCPCYKPGVCPRTANIVPFHGPEEARLVVVGEAPGATENAQGIPFCGDSGRELNRLYLPAAGLAREDVFVANAVRCLPETGTPSRELVSHCSSHFLAPCVRSRKPGTVFVALGRVSGEVMDPLVPESRLLVRAPHPAAAMRDESRTGRIMDEILAVFRRAGRLLRGEDCGSREIRYDWAIADGWRQAAWEFRSADTVALDTETVGVGGPVFCLSLAAQTEAGLASRVLFARDLEGEWQDFIGWLCSRRIVMHHALYDVEAVADCAGWDAALRLLSATEDTMLLAYEIRGLPLGLKPIAETLLGMRMQSFEQALEASFSRALARLLESAAEELERSGARDAELVPPLLGHGEPVPDRMRQMRGEAFADYVRRIGSLPDEELLPLVGRALETPQGDCRDAQSLVAEVNRRFGAATAAAAARKALLLLDGTMEGVRRALAEARQVRLLRDRVPEHAHELLPLADPDDVARYASRDAVATLLLWDELRRIA